MLRALSSSKYLIHTKNIFSRKSLNFYSTAFGINRHQTRNIQSPIEGITIVRDKQTARRVARELLELQNHIHACDTETKMFIDKHGIIGHNIPVICASIFAGDDLNFGTGPIVWIGI